MSPICGIAGFYLRDPHFEVNSDAMLSTLLDEIEDRGRHATGYVAIGSDGMMEWQKAAVSASKFNIYRRPVPEGTRGVLSHTRWATQGDPGFMENNHPIRRGPFYLVHNGHISNDYELFRKAERERFGQVDSEALAARLSSLKDLSKLSEVLSEARGGAAVAAMDERDASRFVVARASTSPLYVYDGQRIVIFASSEKAVLEAHSKHVGKISSRSMCKLDEGEMWEWKNQTLVKSTFEPPKRWVYTPHTLGFAATLQYECAKCGEMHRSWKAAKDCCSDETRINWPKQSRFELTEDSDTIICENCDIQVAWHDINYYRVDGVTFLVCEECFDLMAEEDEQTERILNSNDYDERGSDNFETVNESVLGNFFKNLL